MPTLLSGPAGGGKSQRARELLENSQEPLVVADFQDLYASLLGLRRDASGRYPERSGRHAFALSMAEFLRRAAIRAALERELDMVVTNSDGSPERRQELLAAMGPSAREQVIDPGIDVVRQRLSVNGRPPSQQCEQAISRWFLRVR